MKRSILILAALFGIVAIAQTLIPVKIRGNAPIRIASELPDSNGGSLEAELVSPLKVIGPGKVGHANYQWQVTKTGPNEWTVNILADGVPMAVELTDWN